MLNNLSIQGRLTKEPDLQVTATGVATIDTIRKYIETQGEKKV